MENKKPHITIVLGTARKGRQSEKVANYIYKVLEKKQDISLGLADVKDFNLTRTIPPWEESTDKLSWHEVVKKTDAFIIIVPEYNHSFPGELKLLLDQELKAYENKPAISVGVSAGSFGGARAVESILPVLQTLGLRTLPYPIYFSQVEELFKKDEQAIDKSFKEKVENGLVKLLKAILY